MANKNKGKSKKPNWKEADYGKRFTAKDVKQLSSQGYTGNQILKIGSAASQMDRWKPTGKAMDRTSQALGSLNQGWLNPQAIPSRSPKGGYSPTYYKYPSAKVPKKILTWGGLGDSYRANPLNVNRPSSEPGRFAGPNLFQQKGNWLVPKSMRNATTFGSTMTPVAAAAPVGGGDVGGGGGDTGGYGDMGGDYVPQDIAPEEPGMSAQNGIGAALASYAAGWRPNDSIRKRLGSAAQGLASQRLAPWTTGFVGV